MEPPRITKEEYNQAKRIAKRVVWLAKSEAEKDIFVHTTPHENEVFHIAKQMKRMNHDVICDKCVKNDDGELSLSDKQKMKAWVEHYSRLLNVEFDWPSDSLPEVLPILGPRLPITTTLIGEAASKLKFGKATDPSGIVAEMLSASGDRGIEILTMTTESTFSNGVIPNEWQESFAPNLYKGKGDALDRGNYRRPKLTDQVMKVLEHILKK